MKIINPLLLNKLVLIKALANQDDDEFVYDKDFEEEIRKILTQLNKELEKGEPKKINDRLLDAFEIYKLGLLRAILSNLHFVHYTSELKNQFSAIFIKIKDYIKDNPTKRDLLLKELNDFSESKLAVTEFFITILVEKIDFSDTQIIEIFDNKNLSYRFKFLIFNINCGFKKNLGILVDYYICFITDKSYLPEQIELLIKAYASTGKPGFEVALPKCTSKSITLSNNKIPFYCTKLLAGFGDTFSQWLRLDWKDKKPSIKMIEPLVLALPIISPAYRGAVAEKLIDEWGKDERIYSNICNELRFQQMRDENYLKYFDERTLRGIRSKITLTGQDLHIKMQLSSLKILFKNHVKNQIEINKTIDNASPELLLFGLLQTDHKFSRLLFSKFLYKWSQNVSDNRTKSEYSEKRRKLSALTNLLFDFDNFKWLPQSIRDAIVSEYPFTYYFFRKLYPFKREPLITFNEITNLCSPPKVAKSKNAMEKFQHIK